MLFSSYEFVLLFLPLTLGIYALLLHRTSKTPALAWLLFASLFYYAWWKPSYLLILASSTVFNFALGHAIYRYRESKRAPLLLTLGVAGNLCLLGYYKYSGFIVEIADDLFGTDILWPHIALPLALSFFTFTQIAYLVDAITGRGTRSNFFEYSLFVTFFPHLIAGPIVHHKDLVPQFRDLGGSIRRVDLQVGLVLFGMGLAKKLLIADSLATVVDPTYKTALTSDVTALQAWLGGIGFLLQVYFDFSGYSDMALGASRMFGIRLPMNFNSPLKASSIIAFWARWHISLTQFLTSYVFTPLSMKAMRRLAQRDGPAGWDARGGHLFHGFVSTLVLPIIATMFLSGLWHGAGYQFLVWGLLHGFYLVINHVWRKLLPRSIQKSPRYIRIAGPLGLVVTLLAVSFAAIFFRAKNLNSAWRMAHAAIGGNGLTIPEGVWVHLGGLQHLLTSIGVRYDSAPGSLLVQAILISGLSLLVALAFPNSLEITRDYNPASGFNWNRRPDDAPKSVISYAFHPNLVGAMFVGVTTAIGFLCLSRVSVFLYWQF
jgi:D-alanyl-lipoteichoic acid acyltransferase DltB (MBOAT superfamily)